MMPPRGPDAGHVAGAIAHREVAGAVARYKAVYFAEKGTEGTVIDYAAAVCSMTPSRSKLLSNAAGKSKLKRIAERARTTE